MFFVRDVMCLVMDPNIAFDDLCDDLRDLCKFNSEDPFTMKWIDEEGFLFFRFLIESMLFEKSFCYCTFFFDILDITYFFY